MEKKKLLLVTDAWHPQVNGVVTTFANLLPRLESTGVSVTVIHPGMFFSLPLPGYPEIRLSLFSRRTIKQHIDQMKPDFIHIATEGPLGWTARSICIKRKMLFTTAYATRFDLYAEYRFGGFRWMVRNLLRRFHSKSANVLVATSALKDYLCSMGTQRVAVTPLGVDIELFYRREVTRDRRLTSPVFAYFGRVATEKGIEEFLKCSLSGSKLVIGDGPERKDLEKAYPSVLFVGIKKGEELVRWLSQVDVCVFPSRTDTFGLTIIEALACGIPVAAHDCLGPRDILTDGVDGTLGENLSEGAMRCLAIDRRNCRRKAEQYSWDNAAKAFANNLVPTRRQ